MITLHVTKNMYFSSDWAWNFTRKLALLNLLSNCLLVVQDFGQKIVLELRSSSFDTRNGVFEMVMATVFSGILEALWRLYNGLEGQGVDET